MSLGRRLADANAGDVSVYYAWPSIPSHRIDLHRLLNGGGAHAASIASIAVSRIQRRACDHGLKSAELFLRECTKASQRRDLQGKTLAPTEMVPESKPISASTGFALAWSPVSAVRSESSRACPGWRQKEPSDVAQSDGPPTANKSKILVFAFGHKRIARGGRGGKGTKDYVQGLVNRPVPSMPSAQSGMPAPNAPAERPCCPLHRRRRVARHTVRKAARTRKCHRASGSRRRSNP